MTTNHMHGTARRVAFLAVALSACASNAIGPSEPDGGTNEQNRAYLQIVGDHAVMLANGATKELVVKYIDDSGQPLMGTVSFALTGTPLGGKLSATSGTTGTDGSVHVVLTAGPNGDANFAVAASAANATSVNWTVAVQQSVVQPPMPLNVIGTYQLESQFNLVSGIPGTAGDVVRAIIGMTDDPNDPSSWILDQIAGSSPSMKSALDTVRPALDSVLNSLLEDASMAIVIDGVHLDIVSFFKKFGNAFGDVTQKFGIKSTLQIYQGPNNTLLGKHTITGVFFKIDTKRTDKTLGELNMDNIVVDKIPITMVSESQLTIGQHDIGLSWGTVINFGLDDVLIPQLDPKATSLKELLEDVVPCADLGAKINDAVGFGGANLWESLCETGLAFGASYAEGKLGDISGQASDFKITGTVRPVDTNNDRKVDSLVAGQWSGQLMFGSNPTTLMAGQQTFTGTRVGN